jgi:UDP-N-acetylmuramate dehydrogenase
MTEFALPVELEADVPLAPYTTLRAGGRARWLARARTADEIAEVAQVSQSADLKTTYLGWGSNVLPSDEGVPGLVVLNLARTIEVGEDGHVVADAGCGFQELFLKTAQRSLRGLEFAVGIPGTLGGALVSNAGAYRSSVSEFLTGIEVVAEGRRQWVEPEYMKFAYRDSILRHRDPPSVALVRVRLKLPSGKSKDIYDEAREYQRQRISKQPPPASAGSFFKNVENPALAETIETLPDPLRQKGIVPAGYLIEKAGLKGFRHGGAAFGARHANFVLNLGGASATQIRELAEIGKSKVYDSFGVVLEEEVLYLGDWSSWPS